MDDSLIAFEEALNQLQKNGDLPKAYTTYLHHLQARPGRLSTLEEGLEIALNLMHLQPKDPLPASLAGVLETFLMQSAPYAPAMWNDLGALQMDIRNPLRNMKAARASFEQGARQGDPLCLYNLGLLDLNGIEGLHAPDARLAWSNFAKASLYGLAQASTALADMLAQGMGFPADPILAARLYEEVADQCEQALAAESAPAGALPTEKEEIFALMDHCLQAREQLACEYPALLETNESLWDEEWL